MHHGVRILEDGMEAAVHLSARYLSERQLPDKAVSVLDTACARLALGQGSTPASVEAARRRLDDLAVQTRVLEREAALGADHGDRLAEIAEEKARVESELTDLTARWEKELSLVGRVRDLRKEIEEAIFGDGGEPPAPPTESGEEETEAGGKEGDGKTKAKDKGIQADLDGLKSELGKFDEELRALQGENPLIPVVVDSDLVGQVISGWTGIPVGKMMRDEMGTALSLEQHLGSRIIGQDHAMEVVSHRIRTSFAKIEDPKKPKGVFLFVGPSGVGKTETALALSDLLYGGERNLVTINMSEFQEAHTVSTLKGSPPGYVGYGEGGVLTEAVRRRPYSVVLLDEIEKAHPDVLELFFQVFDKGQMEDGEGRRIDFKNTIIVLTTNAGTDTIMKLCEDPETMPSWEGLVKALKPELDGVFKPAFLGRTVIVPYFPVRDDALKTIVRLKLGKIVNRLQETHRIALEYDDTLIDEVAARCTEVESGARNIDNILTNTLLPDLSRVLLQAMVEGEMPSSIQVSIGAEGAFSYSHSA
jgi:type VI secretion system protein VasG